jgi:hypothetical protein
MEYTDAIKNYAQAAAQLIACTADSCGGELSKSFKTKIASRVASRDPKATKEARFKCFECVNSKCKLALVNIVEALLLLLAAELKAYTDIGGEAKGIVDMIKRIKKLKTKCTKTNGILIKQDITDLMTLVAIHSPTGMY